MKYNKIVLGIDQSYTDTGISISADGIPLKYKSIRFKGCKTKTEKRALLSAEVSKIIQMNKDKAKEFVIIVERIRQFSKGFMSMNYIICTASLISCIVDIAYKYGIEVYSVDTRSWKAKIVGKANTDKDFTLEYVNRRYKLDITNDNIADAICISLYGFATDPILKLEE